MKRLRLNQFLLLALASFMLLNGCHKDFPTDTEGEAALWFQADMPRQKLLEGGKQGYEVKTEIALGDLGVEEHAAIFRQLGCDNCTGQLRMVFRDYKEKEEIAVFEEDSTFRLGKWLFRGQQQATPVPNTVTNPLSFRFSGKSEGTPPFSYAWEFGDGHVSTSPNPIHTFQTSGDFKIKVKIQDATGCSDQSFHQLSVGENFFPCPYDFDIFRQSGQTILLKAKRVDGSPLSEVAGYFWDLGFGPSATIFSDTSALEIQFPFEGIFPVTLLVLDSCGCPCPVTKNVYSGASPSCVSEIAFKTIPQDKETSRLTLEWIDESGTFYTTYGPEGQPRESDFQLLEREPYERNPFGKETYKLSASITCTLYNLTNPNDSIIVRNGRAVFALEVPD